jgi:hypothetical protein
MIKLRRMRLAGHVARMGEKRNVFGLLVEKPEEKRPLGQPHVDRRTILNWILERQDGVVWTGLVWLRIGTSEGML